ncbi:hypothetical protein AT395_25130 (plasmid) [Pandoraea apista]|nr:hypothetical protein AT395_24780 [Pandoraea apista]ALS68427.1 hypothetical protein AT395_25130 [Pandoraea apista]
MSLATLWRSPQAMVVSESDIDAALAHLSGLPFRARSPVRWERQRLFQRIREVIGAERRVDRLYNIAPGVFAIVKPFGIDLAHPVAEPEERLQVWLAIRSVGTDPARISSL